MPQDANLSSKNAYLEQFDVEGLTFFRRLLSAISNKEFVVYFQPKVSISDMKIAGAEALVRWKVNDQVLPPVKFIPFCERTGLVIDIDFYVLEETCKRMRKWLDEGIPLVRISVNFSKYHFNEAGVAERIYKVIKSYNIPPEYIEVEFTETAYLDKEELLEYTVDKLKSYGIKSSIDDFGSGYSSLNLLQNMDFEVVKLDKSLLGKGVENDKAKKVISSIIHMAKELQMEVLAEGVETTEELKLLQDLKCDIVQGFLFDKPLPVEDFERRLRAGGYHPDGRVKEPERNSMELKDVEEITISKKGGNDNVLPASSNRYMQQFDVPPAKEKKHTGILVAGLILILLAITVLAGTIFWLKSDNAKGTNKPADVNRIEASDYTDAELDKLLGERLSAATSEERAKVEEEYKQKIHNAAEVYGGMTNFIRSLFPDEMVFMEGSKYTFAPINRSLKPSTIESAKLSQDPITGFMHYTDETGAKTSYMGIDVSSFQKKVDWNKVKKSGIDFAVIRCGFRGYGSEGKLVEDTSFKDNFVGAKNAGLPMAFYFYTQAIDIKEAEEEAQFVIDMLKPFNVTGPVIIDVESASSTERIKDITATQRTDNIIAFCEKVKEAGYTPMIYSDVKFYTLRMEIERLEDYEKWYANYNGIEMDPEKSVWSYNNPFMFPYEFKMWQYTNKGRIDGVEGDVDLNVLFEKWW